MIQFLAKGGSISLLEADPGLMLWTFLVFGIVLFLLHRFAWEPISRALEKREGRISSDLSKASSLRETAEKKLTEYLAQLDELKQEGEKILQQSKEEAIEQRDLIIQEAKEEATSFLEQSKKEIQLAKRASIAQVQDYIVDLSIAAASQILQRSLSPEDHQRLIQDTIRDVGKLGSLN